MPGAKALALPQNTALIVVDVQNAFDDLKFWGPRNNPQAESNIAKLIAGFRQSGRAVVHIHHWSRSAAWPFQRGTPAFEPKSEATPLPDEAVYVKRVNSSFIGTSLEADLRAAGHNTLVIVGITTNHCVSTTTRMAGNLGFETYLVSDGTFCFDRKAIDGTMRKAADVHAAALSDLNEEFATVVTTDEVISALTPAPTQGIKRTILQRLPIPELPGYESRLVKLEYPPGVAAPLHTHPVPATGIVVEGDVVSQWEGSEVLEQYTAGDSFVDLGGTLHTRSENSSKNKPLVMVLSYVIRTDDANVQLV